MHLDSLVMDLSLILIVAGVATLLMKKLKQPPVLGYIVAGFLVSPNFQLFPSIELSQSITSWGEIGIVFLMFALGLEFSFKKIATVGGSAFVTAITVIAPMTFIGYGVGQVLGWDTMDCVFLGGMLSMSSTMIILKSYEEYRLKEKNFAQVVLGTMVIEDIVGIFMMIILTTVSVSKNVSGGQMVVDIGILLLMLVVWLLAGIYLIPTFLKKVEHLLNDELMVIISLAICFAMVLIATKIGFSSALGAFMAGSILAGTVKSEKIETLIQPIKDLFGAVFFVSVGMLIEYDLLIEYIGPILFIAVVTIFGQLVLATTGLILSGQNLKTAICGGFSMVQIGEFSFIVASMGMSLGVINEFLYPIVVCVSVITSFTTPIFIKNAEKVYEKLNEKLPDKLVAFLERNTSENQAEDDKDADWKRYLKVIGTRTFVCTAAMFAIFWFAVTGVGPVVMVQLPSGGNVVMAVISILAMVPFVAMMHATNHVLFTKLWLKHKANKLPLMTLLFARIGIGAFFMAISVTYFTKLPFAIVMIVALIPAYFIVQSDYVRGMTKHMEMSFIANFNEKTLAHRRKEMHYIDGKHHWIDEEIHVIKFRIIDDKKRTIKDIGRNPHVHVGIIRVYRGDKIFNMPPGNFEVKKDDLLFTMGTQDEIDSFVMYLQNIGHIEDETVNQKTLREFIKNQDKYGVVPEKQLVGIAIELTDDMPFAKSSIKNSGLREKYGASIVGMERANLPIIHPNVATVLMPGDLIWFIGTEEMANGMILDGLLDE